MRAPRRCRYLYRQHAEMKKAVKKVLTWAPDDVQWAARSGKQPGLGEGEALRPIPRILDSVRR